MMQQSDKTPQSVERIGLYPASFDPMTVAHVSIAERAARMLDRLYVAVAVNPAKRGEFSPEERFSLVAACVEHIEVAEPIILEDGLTVDHARDLGAKVMIRGARSVTDFLDELNLFGQNQHVQEAVGITPSNPVYVDTQTYYSLPGEDHVSSSLVRGFMHMENVAVRAERIRPLVPGPVFNMILERLPENTSSEH